jgi:hypothetical protein
LLYICQYILIIESFSDLKIFMDQQKSRYIELCGQEPSIPICNQHWWLDSLSPGKWEVILIEKQGNIIAAMPYTVRKKFNFTFQLMPVLTQNLGIWLKYPENLSPQKKIGFENKIFKEVLDLLPKSDMIHFCLHYSLSNWLPFYWAGYSQTTKYTYIIEGLEDLDFIYGQFDPKVKNKIRKAESIIETVYSDDISKFYEINKKTFQRQKLAIPYSLELLQQHDAVLKKYNARKIFMAIDKSGRIHSALYLTWDRMSSYVHIAGEDPDLRSSGAGIKLIWDAIRYTNETLHLNKMDFEGSMIEGVEQIRRKCGGKQYPYFSLTRFNNKFLKVLWEFKKK